MKIMVTGALGNVGTYVIEELLKMGEEVVAADIDVDKLNMKYKGTTHNVYLDFMVPACFDKALQDVDRIFLMRPPHLAKPEDFKPFMEALKQNNIQFITFLSLMGIEKNPIPPHYKLERFIEETGISYAHVRPGFFMQNVSGIHSVEIREQNQIFVPAGKSKTSFIDAADIGLAVATLLHNPKKYKNTSHTLTGPEALDYNQVAGILSDVTGRKITYAKPSYLKYRHYYINKRNLDKGYVNVTVMLYWMTRMGTAKAVTNEFEKLTGKQPRTFREFARNNISMFNK